MVFSSITFLFVFLPIFLLCYYICKDLKFKNYILLIFSIFFYAWGEPFYVILMILSIIINYFLTIQMDKKKSKNILILIIILNIAMLFSFKYINFAIDIINTCLHLNINNIDLNLPIGISFYTFQALSYVIDVYRNKVKVQKNIGYLACYIFAFPQLIAGPIVRYKTVEKELQKREFNLDEFSKGIRRFIIGISKKVLIANNVAYIADQIFNQSASTYGFLGVLVGAICYTIQIYFDFSGYSDMAIGLGRMLGFHYDENFNYPYMADSIKDFWRRWHISLSSFFRDYVYIPLGGNRVKKLRHIINILIVWLLTGLWHGAAFNFIIWGLYYGILLLLEKYIFANILDKSPKMLRHIYSLILITIGWLIFRATSMQNLFETFKALFGYYGLGNIQIFKYTGILSTRYVLSLVLGIIFSTDIITKKIKENTLIDICLIVLFIISIIFILVGSYNPFIYFRF